MKRHHVHGQGFVIMPNTSATDSRLSFRARGLLAYMLSRPPGWSFDAARMAAEGLEGRDAIRKALHELKALGYYRATRVRTDRGRFVTVTEVAATPEAMPRALPVGASMLHDDVDDGLEGLEPLEAG